MASKNPITVARIFPHWSMGFTYFIVIIKKIPLCNGNSPITDPITQMPLSNNKKWGTESVKLAIFTVNY